MSFLMASLQHYQRLVQSHPYSFNSAQSAVLMAIGDGVAQTLEVRSGKQAEYDGARLLILTSWASGVNAPFWTWWYRVLHARWQGGKVLGWVLASASLSPFWNGAFFCYTTTATHLVKQQEGCLRAKLEHKISTQLVPTVLKSCMLWIPFNYVRGGGRAAHHTR